MKYVVTLWKCHRNAGEEQEESPVKKNAEQTSAVEGDDVSLMPQAGEHYLNSTEAEFLLRECSSPRIN